MSNSGETTSKEHPPKKPQVIIIEDTEEYIHGEENKQHSEEYIKQTNEKFNKKLKADAFLRVFSFFAALLCLWLTISNLGFALVSGIFVILTLRRNLKLNKVCGHFWILCKTFLVCTLGFTIAIFSPPLGIGLILLYVSLRSNVSSGVMNALLRRATEKL